MGEACRRDRRGSEDLSLLSRGRELPGSLCNTHVLLQGLLAAPVAGHAVLAVVHAAALLSFKGREHTHTQEVGAVRVRGGEWGLCRGCDVGVEQWQVEGSRRAGCQCWRRRPPAWESGGVPRKAMPHHPMLAVVRTQGGRTHLDAHTQARVDGAARHLCILAINLPAGRS